MDKSHCAGCHDDVYNHGLGGATECWSLKSAEVLTRYAIGTWTAPTQPGAYTEVRKPSCYGRTGTHYHDRLPDFVRREDVIWLSKTGGSR